MFNTSLDGDLRVLPRSLPESMDRSLETVSLKYAGGRIVALPATWRDEGPTLYTFALFSEELTRSELLRFFEVAIVLGLPNPRPVSVPTLRLASLFHPLLYARFANRRANPLQSPHLQTSLDHLDAFRLRVQPRTDVCVPTARYYLQSLLFLAACTLSAAIIQDRFCEATIASKLGRLWQAAQYVRRFGLGRADPTALERFVVECAGRTERSPYERLFAIKREYGRLLRALAYPRMGAVQVLQAKALSTNEQLRFGFITDLRHRLGDNLRAVIVYGSAVTSHRFADYDLLIVVGREEEAVRTLAGSRPSYNGVEMNCGIYDADDFLVFQCMSGDNLDVNARCVYGEVETLIKPAEDLMLRNFSFAFVRLRQLLGMAAYLSKHGVHPDLGSQSNLYEYLIKIPMHIMKGVRQVAGEPIDKDYLNSWTTRSLGYDIQDQLRSIGARRADRAIANAYLATHGVVAHLNERYKVFEPVPQAVGDLWRHLERPVRSTPEMPA